VGECVKSGRDTRSIDWIELTESISAAKNTKIGEVRLVRGARGLRSSGLHTISSWLPGRHGEFNVGAMDSTLASIIPSFCAMRWAPGFEAISRPPGSYRPEDFRTGARQVVGNGLIVLSFWSDVSYALYRHRRLSFDIPFALSGNRITFGCAKCECRGVTQGLRSGWMAEALRRLQTTMTMSDDQ